MPPKDPTRYDARTHLFVGGLKGAGKTEALLARASAWVGPDYEGVTFRDARPRNPNRRRDRRADSKSCSKESPGFNRGRNCVSHPAFAGFGYTAE